MKSVWKNDLRLAYLELPVLVSPQYASSRARGPQFLAGITYGVGR